MPTEAQLKANRANAQLSTGPTSDTGRETVSHNSTKHGLTGRFTLNTDEDHAKFMESYKRLIRDLNASTALECDLVLRMAEALWRSERSVMLQDECIDKLSFDDESVHAEARKNLELYIRYQTAHDRAYQRYAAELRKFQAEMKKSDIGFVSQKREEAQENRRAAAETRKTELHGVTMQIKKQRLEREKYITMLAAMKAGAEMSSPGTKNNNEPASNLRQLAAA